MADTSGHEEAVVSFCVFCKKHQAKHSYSLLHLCPRCYQVLCMLIDVLEEHPDMKNTLTIEVEAD